jgi:hypothetical protein
MQGIPIDELIVWNEKLCLLRQATMKTTPRLNGGQKVTPVAGLDELTLIRDMEREFACQAAGVLERLNLSHLLVQAQK